MLPPAIQTPGTRIQRPSEAVSQGLVKVAGESLPTGSIRASWHYRLQEAATGRVLHDSGWMKNVICDTNGLLLAALNKGQAGYTGIAFLAVGRGDAAWDTSGVPEPSPLRTRLVDELARQAVTIAFLDGANQPTAQLTNRLEVSAVFGDGQADGAHREFALFGGNATAAPDSGLMVNYRTQQVKHKGAGEQLTITVRVIYT